MRLLNAQTLNLKVFENDAAVPKYAILSHTWGDDEVSFQDMLHSVTKAKSKEGFKKIQFTATQALKEQIDYIWVDTCCIDKSSSAELTEAINSMFRWYKKAEVCYVYLADVDEPQKLDSDHRFVHLPFSRWKPQIRKSRWFTRGWTLQELIAPRNLVFYSANWYNLGTKKKHANFLASITGIHQYALRGGLLSEFSIAIRMSWAARRNTTRVEDLAYCLLGIFGVYMPMLYGEGERAFIRLQEEILKLSDDLSIFCWKSLDTSPTIHRGLLARSPAEFSDEQIRALKDEDIKPCQFTNKGLMIELPLKPREGRENEYCATLSKKQTNYPGYGIYLTQLSTTKFARVDAHQFWKPDENESGEKKTICVKEEHDPPQQFGRDRIGGIYVIDAPPWATFSHATRPESPTDLPGKVLLLKGDTRHEPTTIYFALHESCKQHFPAHSALRIDMNEIWNNQCGSPGWQRYGLILEPLPKYEGGLVVVTAQLTFTSTHELFIFVQLYVRNSRFRPLPPLPGEESTSIVMPNPSLW